MDKFLVSKNANGNIPQISQKWRSRKTHFRIEQAVLNVANVKMLPIPITNNQLDIGTGNIGTGNIGNISTYIVARDAIYSVTAGGTQFIASVPIWPMHPDPRYR